MAPMLLRFVINKESDELGTAPMAQLRVTWGNSSPVCIPERKIPRQLPPLLAKGKPERVEIFWWAGDPTAPERIRGGVRGCRTGPPIVDAH